MTDDFLVCFPSGVDWDMTKGVKPAEPFPAPLVTSRDGQEDVIPHPRPVDDLAAYAQEHGWDFQIRYSEGWVPHGTTGKPIGPKVLWSVRMRRGQVNAIAVRTDGQWTSLWTVDKRLKHYPTLAALKEALE